MKRTILATIAISAVAGAVVIPSLALGNARRTTGSLSAAQAAGTPYIAELKGSNEVPTAGDPDGTGAATVSFAALDATNTEVCFDLAYSGIANPTAAHIHTGAAGSAGGVVVPLGTPPPSSGCVTVLTTVAQPIIDAPANFYVNVHNADFPNGALRGQLAKGPAPAGAQIFLPTPLRAYDSRIAPATKMNASETRTVSLATGKDTGGLSSIAVPPGATAAIVTITATETSGASFLKVYSAASPEPATSNVNFTVAGATVAVSTQVAVDASGSIKITSGPAGTHVLVDVIGYLY